MLIILWICTRRNSNSFMIPMFQWCSLHISPWVNLNIFSFLPKYNICPLPINLLCIYIYIYMYQMGRSSGFNLGGAFSSHRPQQQSSNVSSFASANNQDLHHLDMFQQGSHTSYHSQVLIIDGWDKEWKFTILTLWTGFREVEVWDRWILRIQSLELVRMSN